MSANGERRRVQRYAFEVCLDGQLSAQPVKLIDLSLDGAAIIHNFALQSGRIGRFEFRLEGESVAIIAEVVRCRFRGKSSDGFGSYQSGLRFHEGAGLKLAAVRKALTLLVTRELEEQKRSRNAAVAVSA
jgi:hypothetical protein